MTRVYWTNLNRTAGERGAWDMGIVAELTAGFIDQAPDCFEEKNGLGQTMAHEIMPAVGFREGAVVTFAGQHNASPVMAEAIAAFVAKLPWALTIVTSDEEALFPVELLPRDATHKVWGQYHARLEFDRVIPIGCPPGTARVLAELDPPPPRKSVFFDDSLRTGSVCFAGQDTHVRRHELLAVMKEMATDGHDYGIISWAATTGFAKGLASKDYLTMLTRTRIAPCPSGPHSLDSFRLYEALAAGALPVIETHTPHGDEREFWRKLQGELPGGRLSGLPCVDSWSQLPGIVEYFSDPEVWREARDQVQDWWAVYRSQLQTDFAQTIQTLRAASE